MHPTALSVVARPRVTHVSVFALLMIAIALFGGCNRGQPNRNVQPDPRASQSPTTSPSPVSTPKPETEPGDTPIVIKDGTVYLDFNDTHYVLDAQSTNPVTYLRSGRKLHYVSVQPQPESQNWPLPTICPVRNPSSTIKISAGGANNDLEVTGTSNTVKFVFDKVVYPPCQSHKGCNTANHIQHVRINTGRPCKVCTPNDRCEVTVHTQY